MDEFDRPADECGCTLELIWDEDLNATALTGAASPISDRSRRESPAAPAAGPGGVERADDVVSDLAAATGVPVDGYVSSARLLEGLAGGTELTLTPCVVVSSEADGRLVTALWPEAVRYPRTLRLLRDRLRIEPAVWIAPPT